MKLRINQVIKDCVPTSPQRSYTTDEGTTVVRTFFDDGVVIMMKVFQTGNSIDRSDAGHYLEMFEFMLGEYYDGNIPPEINLNLRYHRNSDTLEFTFTFTSGLV